MNFVLPRRLEDLPARVRSIAITCDTTLQHFCLGFWEGSLWQRFPSSHGVEKAVEKTAVCFRGSTHYSSLNLRDIRPAGGFLNSMSIPLGDSRGSCVSRTARNPGRDWACVSV
jgi:hypothetical protein